MEIDRRRRAYNYAAQYLANHGYVILGINNRGRPIATVENIQRHMGQAQFLVQQAQAQLYHTAQLWDQYPEQRITLGSWVNVAKVTATNNAIEAVDQCMRVVGGSSLLRSLPIERYYRDVRGGLNHPVNDDAAYVALGKQALS